MCALFNECKIFVTMQAPHTLKFAQHTTNTFTYPNIVEPF